MTGPQKVLPYNPLDWYWRATDGRIYASGRNIFIHSVDTGYRTFVAKLGGVTPWPVDTLGQQTNDALQAVLTPYGITIPTT